MVALIHNHNFDRFNRIEKLGRKFIICICDLESEDFATERVKPFCIGGTVRFSASTPMLERFGRLRRGSI